MIEFPQASTAEDYPLLIKHLLHSPLQNSPDNVIVSGDYRFTYAQFYERIKTLAQGLTSLGVKFGDTVAVMDWDCHRYLECFFAVPMMGCVLHTINIRLSPEQMLYTINHAEDDVILVHEDFLPVLSAIRDRITRPVKLVFLTDTASARPDNFDTDYDTLMAVESEDMEFPDFDERSRATIFYTTGTTGEPKGVTYSHRQLMLHTLGAMAGFGTLPGTFRFHNDDVYMPITPMFHVHAWGIPYVATLAGVKQVYPGRYDPATLLSLIQHEQVTFSHCVPTILHMLLNAPEAASTPLQGWKVIIGGSALPEGLAQAALEAGIDICAAYGMSETCPVLTVANLPADQSELEVADSVAQRCKTGKAIPLVELDVVDATMNALPRDGASAGEIVVRAPWLAQGYVKDPVNSETLWEGGYLHTGDVGHIDPEGTLQITDRMKDVIKSGGEWISSLDLESLASTVPGVAEVAAIGVPDERWGERPLLIITLAEGAAEDTVRQAIIEQIESAVEAGAQPRWAIPNRIECVDSIDRTSVGKLNKKVLRERYR